jgi:hypothetical protein
MAPKDGNGARIRLRGYLSTKTERLCRTLALMEAATPPRKSIARALGREMDVIAICRWQIGNLSWRRLAAVRADFVAHKTST